MCHTSVCLPLVVFLLISLLDVNFTIAAPLKDPLDESFIAEKSSVYRNMSEIFTKVGSAYGIKNKVKLRVTDRDVSTFLRPDNRLGFVRKPEHVKGGFSKMVLAWQYGGTVVLEESLYDLAGKFGHGRDQAALAFVIGHELTHYFDSIEKATLSNYTWANGFCSNLAKGMTKSGSRESTEIIDECRADFNGGFFAFAAGYDSLELIPSVIDAVYDNFDLKANLPGYPTRDQRKLIGVKVQQELQTKVPIFTMARALLLAGRYEQSARLFDELAAYFPGREMYLNAGVARTLQAISLLPIKFSKFSYPLTIESQTRMQVTKGLKEEEKARHLLNTAVANFKIAIQRNPDSSPAHLNLAIAYTLLENASDAAMELQISESLAIQGREQGNTHALRGIIKALAGDTESAKVSFNKGADLKSVAASSNLNLFNPDYISKALFKSDPTRLEVMGAADSKNGKDPSDWFPTSHNLLTIPISKAGEKAGSIVSEQQPDGWDTLKYVDGKGNTQFVLFTTTSDYPQKWPTARNDIKRGSSAKEVQETYGNGERIETSQGDYFLIYREGGIIFDIRDDKVHGWSIYYSFYF